MNTLQTPARIDLLYMAGCSSYRHVWGDLLEVIIEGNLDVVIRLVRVTSQADADRLHFAGSPTVKVNGRDLEGYAGSGALACRLYAENGGKGWPSRTLLRAKLLEQVMPL